MGYALWIVGAAAGLGAVAFSMQVAAPPLPWVALAIALYASRQMPAVAAIATVWVAAFVVIGVGEYGRIPAPGAVYPLIVAVLATAMAAPFAIDRVAGRALPGPLATLAFPFAFVAIEFVRSRVGPSGSWGSIAYTQFGSTAVMQVAAYVGIWGITFLIAWFASVSASAASLRFDSDAVRTPASAFGVVMAIVLVGGAIRASASVDGPTLRVATLNRPPDLFAPGEITRITEGAVAPEQHGSYAAKLAHLHDAFLEGASREARAGARLIVVPEQNLLVFAGDERPLLDRVTRVAADLRVYLAIGMGTIHLGEKRPFENKLVLIDPSGNVAMSYLKSHPVPGWEASIMRIGDGRLPVVATREGRMGGAICFDADFPEFVRQASAAAADLLILPANDWRAIKDAHFRMHAFRAVETGLPIIRAASSGLSGAFDPRGRVLGAVDFFAPGDRTLVVQLPVGRVPTLYARIGDALAWACVAATAILLVAAATGLRAKTVDQRFGPTLSSRPLSSSVSR